MGRGQRGSATVVSVGIMIVLLIFIAGLMPMLVNEVKFGTINRDAIEAQYAAEAGAKRAITEFNHTLPDWSWLNSDRPFLDDVNTKRYNVVVYSASDASHKPVSSPNLTTANYYVIKSTGTVGRMSKTVLVEITEANGNVFNKYAAFSSGDLFIWGGSPAPTIMDKIGTLGSNVNIGSSEAFLNEIVDAIKENSGWYPKGTPGWYNKTTAENIGDFDAISIPPMPGMTEIPALASTNPTLPSNATYGYYNESKPLTGEKYYFDKSYTLTQAALTAEKGQEITMYINGDLHLTNSSIIGNHITILATGSVTLDNNSFINVFNSTDTSNLKIYAKEIHLTTNAYIKGDDVSLQSKTTITLDNTNAVDATNSGKSGKMKLYANGIIHLTNNAIVNGDLVEIQTNSTNKEAILLDNTSSINKEVDSAITKIYSNGGLHLTNQVKIGGKAGQVIANNNISIDNQVQAPNTVFISNSNSSRFYITGNTEISGIYTKGSIKIDGAPIINHKKAVIKELALSGATGLQTRWSHE